MRLRVDAGSALLEAFPEQAGLHGFGPVQFLHDALERGEPGVTRVGPGLRVSADQLRASPDSLLAFLGVHRYLGDCSIEEKGLVGHRHYRWHLDWGCEATASGAWLTDGTRHWLLGPEHEAVTRLAGEVPGLGKLEVFRRIHQLAYLARKHARILPTRRLLSRTILYPDEVRAGGDASAPVPRLLERGSVLDIDVDTVREAAATCQNQDGLVKLPGEDRWLLLDRGTARAVLALLPRIGARPAESSAQYPDSGVTLPAPPAPKARPVLPWLAELPSEGARRFFAYLAEHTAITEAEMQAMFPNPRAVRAFTLEFERWVEIAPFGVRIETVGGTKRYVREERSR